MCVNDFEEQKQDSSVSNHFALTPLTPLDKQGDRDGNKRSAHSLQQ